MAKNRGYVWDEYTQSYRATADAIKTINDDIQKATDEGASEETIIELRKQAGDLEQLLKHDNKRDALSNLLANYQDAEMYISDFQSQFNIDLEAAGAITVKDGKKIIDIDKLNELVEGYDDLFKSVIEQRADEYIENASKAGQLITQGTNSQVEMSAFKEAYSQLTGGQTVDFFYDSVLKAWTFDANKLRTYFENAAEKLNLGDQTSQWVEDQIDTVTTENLDFSSYLSGTISTKDTNILKHNLETYFKTHTDGFMPYMGTLSEWAKNRTESTLNALSEGGQVAINTLKSIKSDLTTEEIEAAYRAQIAPIIAVQDTLADLQQGSIVATNQIDILTKAGFTVNADGVVTVVGDLVTAYQSIYDQMQETGEATIAELNSSYAKLLTSKEQSDIDAIAAMGDAMGMTYDTLGQILEREGTKLEDWMNNAANKSMYEQIGAGKVRITDFTKFAAQRGWEPGSEEYTSAFKSYNDSMIELNKKAKTSIQEEVSALKDVKGGDQLNLTNLYTTLQKQFQEQYIKHEEGTYKWELIDEVSPLKDLQDKLKQYNAHLEDGILSLDENANLIEIGKALKDAAQQAGADSAETIAEIEDALNEVIQSYIEAIKAGIQGTLNVSQKLDLETKASSLGINNLSFEQTTEGFKLAQQSAIQLYNALKQIDAMQAKLVFDELNKSLQESNENYQSISSILNRMQQINTALGDEKVSDARKQQYEEELALAKEILAVRSTSEDSSVNFMSNKIPGGQNNPLNYYKNWAQAFSALKAAGSKNAYSHNDNKWHRGLLNYEDWYNIVNEMNNLAGLGKEIEVAGVTLDGSLEAASALIQKGVDTLTQADTGELMVSLGDMGIKFKAGSGEMSAGIEEGIHNLANSQVHMLDGMIALLETIVAMEGLADVAGEDMELTLPEIVVSDPSKSTGASYSDTYAKWRDETLKKLDDTSGTYDDLQAAFKSVEVNGKSLETIVRQNANEFTELDAQILNAFMQASKSGNYDINNIASSMQTILQNVQGISDLEEGLAINIGDYRFRVENGIVVEAANLTSDAAKNALKTYKETHPEKTEKEAKDAVLTAIENYKKGQPDENSIINTEQFLEINENIIVNKNGKKTIKYKGKTITKGEKDWDEAVTATLLKEQEGVNGITDDDIKYDAVTKTASVEVTYGIEGQSTKFKVITDQSGKTTWEGTSPEGNKETGSSREELLENLFRADNDLKGSTEPVNAGDFKAWVYANYGIYTHINPTFYNQNGDKLDVNDPQLQTELGKIFKSGKPLTYEQKDGYINVDIGSGFILKLDEENFKGLEGADLDNAISKFVQEQYSASLKETISSAITDALGNLPGLFETLANGPVEGADNKWTGVFTAIGTGASTAAEKVQDLINKLKELNGGSPSGNNPPNEGPGEGQTGTTPTQQATPAPAELRAEAQAPTITANVEADTTNAETSIEALTPTINVILNPIDTAITTLLSKGYSAKVNLTPGSNSPARGTIGLAHGNAHAAGTLMGELGPELVVSKGRYFVVGQNGPEMVNLADDAIVFNHIQTRSLLEKGTSSTRGHAITNEYTAASYAKGSIHGGPAMSSASAALAALKQLRAQWASLANLSAKDLAGAGGGGGGGGGKDAAFIKELERWYNYLQKIAQLEKEINFEEAKRNRIKSQSNRSGSDYYKSQKESLKDLKEESETYRKLAAEQQAYFNKRRDEMNKKSNPFTSLYTFDENGQLKYQKGAFEKLSKISGRDNTGKPNKTPKQQYDAIVKMNPKFKEFMKYDSSGNKIEYKNGKPKDDAAYQAAIQAFWDKIEADKQEMQSLHDSIEDAKVKQEELDTKRNELLQEMKDNQMSVEDKVLKAIEDQRQRAIDKLSDERSALEKSTGKYIQGLSDALNKEREMYEKSDSADELNRLMRQLDILKRSGGSEIRDIEGQIREKQRDAYFDAQQEQIDKVQEASDLQLERLDTQIEIMTEALEYQKQMGLLWDEVYQVMSGSAEDITAFIMGNTTEFWEKSPLALEQEAQQTFFEADQWQAYRDDLDVIAEGQGTDTPTSTGGSSENSGGGSSGNDKQAASRTKYKVTYTDKKGKEQTKTFKTKEEADTYKKSIEKDKKNKKGTKVTVSTLSYYVYAFKKGWKKGDSAKEFGPYTKADANKKKTSLESNASYAYKTTKKKIKVAKTRPKGYSEGGYDYDTGLAMLHGTPAKPEAVLNAAQTKVLRDNILSKKPNSLLSLLEAYNEAYKDGIGTITNNEGITIENATVNMNVQQIANDYDAQRAGEQALAEMLRIARKTSAANSVRR